MNRRQFLKRGIPGVAALAFVPVLIKAPKPKHKDDWNNDWVVPTRGTYASMERPGHPRKMVIK